MPPRHSRRTELGNVVDVITQLAVGEALCRHCRTAACLCRRTCVDRAADFRIGTITDGERASGRSRSPVSASTIPRSIASRLEMLTQRTNESAATPPGQPAHDVTTRRQRSRRKGGLGRDQRRRVRYEPPPGDDRSAGKVRSAQRRRPARPWPASRRARLDPAQVTA